MQGFQKAMCDLVASPELCLLLRETPDLVLQRYELSPRDRRRLVDVVWQPGMVVNCSLYRANRITPLYNLLPHTCFLLDDVLMREATEFWKDFEETRLQFKDEVEKFGDFLKKRIELGFLQNEMLGEVLEYELAVNEFRFAARLDILSRLTANKVAPDKCARIRLHPLVKVLLFKHEPGLLIRWLDERRQPPYELAQGEFWLLLDGKGEEMQTKPIVPELGRLLAAIEAGSALPLGADDVEMLVEAGLAVRLAYGPASL